MVTDVYVVMYEGRKKLENGLLENMLDVIGPVEG